MDTNTLLLNIILKAIDSGVITDVDDLIRFIEEAVLSLD